MADPRGLFGRPLEKLVEVVAQGIGAVAGPWIMKRQAKALREANEDLVKGNLMLEGASLGDSFEVQVADRVAHLEGRRQRNLAAVVDEAQKAIGPSVSEEVVDEDWTTRFFSYAQDVSSEQMQELWGRLLCGEVERPGSFSLRTLECVRLLSPSEAKLFETAISISIGPAIPTLENGPNFPRQREVFFSAEKAGLKEWLADMGVPRDYPRMLKELGLVVGDYGDYRRFTPQKGTDGQFYVGVPGKTRRFLLAHPSSGAPIAIPATALSGVGTELLSALPVETSPDLAAILRRGLEDHGVVVEELT